MVISFPPPHHGANIANQILWSSDLQNYFDCSLLDISDHRSFQNLGRFEIINIYLAISHLFMLAWQLLRQRPQLVYLLLSQNSMAYLRDGFFILTIKLLSRAKVVAHIHGGHFRDFYDGANSLIKKFIDYTATKIDIGVVYSKRLRYLLDKWVVNICTVPNGTNLFSDIDLGGVIKRRRSSGRFQVLYLSNLFRSKGIVEVVKSAVEVTRSHPEVVYKVAGDFGKESKTLRPVIEELVRAHSLQDKVHFLGVVTGEDKNRLLLESDCFVLPTYYPYEGQPVSIIEAMSAGCPVITTSAGAIPDTVVDAETGIIVQPKRSDLVAKAIIRLAEDEGLCRNMSLASRKRYEDYYTLERFAHNFCLIFNLALTV